MMGRIATVGYLNARPLTDGIDRDRHCVVADYPAAIARMLHDDEVDLALVPVAAILNGGDWMVVPGVCIGADGPVDSVFLAAETPPEAWTRVVLDGESRTSAVLARLLLKHSPLGERAGEVEIEVVDPGAGPELARGTTAALVIGDAARRLPRRLSVRIDLAEEWKAWTGLPFVFAVWAGRPDVRGELVDHLRQVGLEGISRIDGKWTGNEHTYLAERIRYSLDDRARMGLRRFAALAKRSGLLASEHIELYGPTQGRIERPDVDGLLSRTLNGELLGFDDAMRLEAAAPLTELVAAADLKRANLHPDGIVGYRTEADTDVHTLVVGAGESGRDRVRALLSLRGGALKRLRVVAADHPGMPAASEANTAVDHLRAVALARLLLDVPHLEASVATEGIGMSQASLRAGCDHLGTVTGLDESEIVRQIRDAGFEPRRDRIAATAG